MDSQSSSNIKHSHSKTSSGTTSNIIRNHDFSRGLASWRPNSEGLLVKLERNYAVITNRNADWQGLEQDLTGRVLPGSTYIVSARVGVSGPLQGPVSVLATLRLESLNSATPNYLSIARASVSKDQWGDLEGTFSLPSLPDRIVFYLEGPYPGVDLLIQSVTVSCLNPRETDMGMGCVTSGDENIILNPSFGNGLKNWSGRGCKIAIHDSMGARNITPMSGTVFASATQRTQTWNGIEQDITERVKSKIVYEFSAIVRIFSNNMTQADVEATMWVQTADLREEYITIASSQATVEEWVRLKGKFILNGSPSKVIIYLEGPPPGTDILLNSLVVKPAEKVPPSPRPVIKNAAFGVNIITNSSLTDGTNGWLPLGACTLTRGTGSPTILPPMARDSLRPHEPLSGHFILVKNRTETWMGPSQLITGKVKLYLTYQVTAWVRISSGSNGPQNVSFTLSLGNNQWVNGGQVEVSNDQWHELGGSFRIEKEPAQVMAYVHGPASGVDLMVAGLHIFPVDRQARFRHLKNQTDKRRKRDVILKISGTNSGNLVGTIVKVRQTENSFPFGSCVSSKNMDSEDFVNFFLKNFNWAVFGNELKWYWTERHQGKLNYKDADDLLNLCDSHGIQTRGHCIFWEVEGEVQPWLKSLNNTDLMGAIQNRLNSLLTRYKGKFKHYDVNNEMLHGSFYQDRLGKDIRAKLFKIAKKLDPSATLFVNDYHVEDGCDYRSSPEKYIQHILELQEQGAPVGGIGIQGHIDNPVGPIVCSALDKMSILGLPIWFTELEVSSVNQYVRADDLEVMLREAFAHPAVEGIVLWGFWELFMSRDNSHLVNAEGDVNEAGKRYLALKQEWLSQAHGRINEQGQFGFRGFQGTYEVEVVTASKKILKTFVVDKGESPLVISIDL